jgi:hypothetical protein
MRKIQVKNTATIPVKITDKLTIMIKPGDDPEEARQRFLGNIDRVKQHYSDRQRLNTAETRKQKMARRSTTIN